MNRINAAVEDDYLEYREALHALKGSSTELGAQKLVEVCLKGEALKPYHIGKSATEKIAAEIAEVFQHTSAALSNAAKNNPASSGKRDQD